jgi:putative Mg2+ transporter-C (MgtC) family protein
MQISNLDQIVRIACAMLCGAIVGWERERREKAAGLRTHMFVCLGSALLMVVSSFGFADAISKGVVVLDPSRIAAQVVSGIGFLGAGVIWFNRNKVRGLDTAAGIWTTSAVGLAAGAGMYVPAFSVTASVLLMNMLLKPIEQRLFPRRKDGHLLIALSEESNMDDIRRVVDEAGLKIRSVRLVQDADNGSVGLDVNGPKSLDWLSLIQRVQNVTGVHSVSFNEPYLESD